MKGFNLVTVENEGEDPFIEVSSSAVRRFEIHPDGKVIAWMDVPHDQIELAFHRMKALLKDHTVSIHDDMICLEQK